MRMFILIYLLFLLIIEAYSDSLYYRKNNSLAHIFKAVWILALMFFGTFQTNFLLMLLAYVFIRFGIFNYLFNIFSGLHWTYLSPDVLPDKFLRRIPLFHLLFMQLIITATGVIIIFNEL